MVTSNPPFNEWTAVLGSERLTIALLDRLTHHVYILEMNGESYRLKESKRNRPQKSASRMEFRSYPGPARGRDRQECLPLRPKRSPASRGAGLRSSHLRRF